MDTALAFQAGYQGSIPQYNYNFFILSLSFKVWWLSKPQPLRSSWEISTKEAVIRMFLFVKGPYFLRTQLFCVKKAIQAKEWEKTKVQEDECYAFAF